MCPPGRDDSDTSGSSHDPSGLSGGHDPSGWNSREGYDPSGLSGGFHSETWAADRTGPPGPTDSDLKGSEGTPPELHASPPGGAGGGPGGGPGGGWDPPEDRADDARRLLRELVKGL